MDKKTCHLCGNGRSLRYFYKDRKSPDGHKSYCRYCQQGYQAEFLHWYDKTWGLIEANRLLPRKRTSMNLTIESSPQTTHGQTLQRLMRPGEWKKLRETEMARSGHHCEACGATGILHCHEVWDYDDDKHVQRLKNFMVLCQTCHIFKHLDSIYARAIEGRLEWSDVVEHYIRVNDCSGLRFWRDRKAALAKWKRREKHKWEVDLGPYKNKLKRIS